MAQGARPSVTIPTTPKTSMFDPETGHRYRLLYGFAAQAVDEVDVETGFVEVLNVVCADDVGKAISPSRSRADRGAIVQAHGYALMEDFRCAMGASD